MKNYEELTRDLIDYYINKFEGELTINSIDYRISVINDNHTVKLENKYHVSASFKLLTLDVYSWNIPHQFSSKVSFENALKMLKIAVDGFLNAIMIEKEFVEVKTNKLKLINLLSKELLLLSNEDFSFIIDHYVTIEDYNNAAKYEALRKKTIKE